MMNSADERERPPQMEKVFDIALKVLTALVLPLLWWVNALSVHLALLDENNKRMEEEIKTLRSEAKARDAELGEIKGSVGEIKTTLIFVREKVKEIADAIHTHP